MLLSSASILCEGAWNESRQMVFLFSHPGHSGDVRDAHYRDLYPLWARGRYFPIFYSRSRIESVLEKTFVLEPGGSH